MRLVMEEEPRKRKITNINDEEEEEDEDVKMEKFFALIRSAKDIRDQLLDTTEGSRPIATTAAATVAAAAAKSEKKAVAKADKRAEVVKVHRKEKSLVDSQNTASKPGFTVAKFNQPSAPAVASASGGGSGGVGGGKASIEEEKGGKKSADYKINNSNQKGGRVILDLNLSL